MPWLVRPVHGERAWERRTTTRWNTKSMGEEAEEDARRENGAEDHGRFEPGKDRHNRESERTKKAR